MKRIDIEEYKNIVVGILVKIDSLCRENGLTYALTYGTLLGAVRHNGFIPWDDDADIAMPRKDYDNLAAIIRANPECGLDFLSIDDNPDTIYPFGKICDTRTVLHENNFRDVEGLGAFVDVFPFDHVPSDKKKRNRIRKKYRWKVKLITHSSRTAYVPCDSFVRNVMKSAAFHICSHMNTARMIKEIDSHMRELDSSYSEISALPWDEYDSAFPDSILWNVMEHDFEGHSLLIPVDYDVVLKSFYGDYMKFPPVDEQVNKHDLQCFFREDM